MKLDRYRIVPGQSVNLNDWDAGDERIIGKKKGDAKKRLDAQRSQLGELQEKFYADGRHRLLLLLQAMDTAGKDSTIRHVFQGVDPLGVRVAGFRAPSTRERAHDYLWRVHREVPANGEIVIFNRSHYEDVLVTRVEGWIDRAECERRYRHIADFERMLGETGTTILKCYLHIDRDEQKKRLEERRDTPTKQWKFQPEDLAARGQWEDYRVAYEAALTATATLDAPWYVVPANSKLARNLLISQLLIETLQALDLRYPAPAVGLDRILID